MSTEKNAEEMADVELRLACQHSLRHNMAQVSMSQWKGPEERLKPELRS